MICRFPLLLILATGLCISPLSAAEPLKLEKGDHVVLIGNTLAERMQYFGNFETLLHSRFPEKEPGRPQSRLVGR